MSDQYFEQENQEDMIAGLNRWHIATIKDYLNTIYNLESRIAYLEDQLRWRDVKDELPPVAIGVFEATTEDGNIHIIWFANGEWRIYYSNVVKWRPIPRM